MTDTPPPAAPSGTPDPADVEKNKVMAILAYIWLLVIVTLIAAKDSPFARYHANQGLLLLIAGFCAGVCLGIIGVISALVFAPLACLVFILDGLFALAYLAMVIMGVMNAANGKMKPLPVIGTLFTIIK